MSKEIEISINNKRIKAKKGQTILQVAKDNGIEIPSLCFHSDLKIKPNCRICLVEIKGRKRMETACSTKIEQGMKIITNSPEIRKARRINLELLFSQHREECDDCVWGDNCQLLKLAEKYNVRIDRFKDRKSSHPVYQFGPSLIFDSSKCIDCRNCVDVCEKQGIGFLEMEQKGAFFQIVPSKDKNKDCIYCGQCITHCPAGAFEAVGEFEDIEKPFQEKNKFVVFQIAPSIRTSIGEEFGLDYGTVITEKLVAAIKKLGADKVFDVSVGADFTTTEEAEELVKRIENKGKLPMFTSCCPAWVKFVEFYEPELIPNLTTVRSPHIISGGLIKTFFAQENNIKPEDVTVVSIMPCVAKKYEIQREELKINPSPFKKRWGVKPVDYVLTTRELAFLLKKKNIDLKRIKPEKIDFPLGIPSGAGVIYGASGGVMESALRTAYEKIVGKKLKNIDFKKVRGQEGCKKAAIKINSRNLKIGVVNGIANAKKIIEELKKNPKSYDYIEVMACFGGCIGGGGQPIPVDADIRKKRAQGLYQVDTKKEIRSAHQNPIVKKVYQDFFDKEKIHKICHTKYRPLAK